MDNSLIACSTPGSNMNHDVEDPLRYLYDVNETISKGGKQHLIYDIDLIEKVKQIEIELTTVKKSIAVQQKQLPSLLNLNDDDKLKESGQFFGVESNEKEFDFSIEEKRMMMEEIKQMKIRLAEMEKVITNKAEEKQSLRSSSNDNEGFSYKDEEYENNTPELENGQDIQEEENVLSRQVGHYIGVDEDGCRNLPEDSFTLMMVSKTFGKAFMYSLGVFTIQVLICIFLIVKIREEEYPPNVAIKVRCVQFIAFIIASLTQDDIIKSVEELADGYSETRLGSKFKHITMSRWILGNIFRLTEGILVLTATFFLVVCNNDIQDILLNFTAMQFVSFLDDIAFNLAEAGFCGTKIARKVAEVKEKKYQTSKNFVKLRAVLNQAQFSILFGVMIACWGVITNRQINGYYMCEKFYVEFRDNALVPMSSSSGIYERSQSTVKGYFSYKEARNVSQKGVFTVCENEWIFGKGEVNSCDSVEAKSQSSLTYDLREAFLSPWTYVGSDTKFQKNVDNLEVFCLDNNINELHDFCPIDSYGITCEDNNACPTLSSVKNSRDFMDMSFFILKHSSINKSVETYNHPIYIGQYKHSSINTDIISFTGSHWIRAKLSSFDKLLNMTTVDSLAETFLNSSFHSSIFPYQSVSYITESILGDSPDPIGLKWFLPRYTKNQSGLPMLGSAEPVEFQLECTDCDSKSSPCFNDGICHGDGSCECMHGTSGMKCEILPVSNGVCNSFFNIAEYDFDGGDCCGASCQHSKCGIGGFESPFYLGDSIEIALGYSNCIDPRMVPIAITLTVSSLFYLSITLECDGIQYMHIPSFSSNDRYGGIFPKSTEIVYVKDGTNCNLLFDLDGEYFSREYFSNDYNKLVHFEATVDYGKGANDKSGRMTTYSTDSSEPLLYAKGSFTQRLESVKNYSFVVIKECFYESSLSLDTHIRYDTDMFDSRTLIWDLSSPQGQALNWLNLEDSSWICQISSELLFQRYALATLEFALNNTLSQHEGTWLKSIDECEWQPGITCTSNGLVNRIELKDLKISGSIPSEVGILNSLEVLNLGRNNLKGTISKFIGSLTNLRTLSLWGNQLTGSLPSELEKLTKLETIRLSFNKLAGTLPSEIINLVRLRDIDFESSGKLQGTIFPEIARFPNLEYLNFKNISLTGMIPTELFNISSLIELNLDFNQIHGRIPVEVGNLRNLRFLSLIGNVITGIIPSEIGLLSSLESIIIGYSSDLKGTLPTEIGQLRKIKFFSMFNNSLEGSIPSQFGYLTNLEIIWFSNNNLTGQIPTELGSLSNLYDLRLDQNRLQGTIPYELGSAINLEELYLYRNNLEGSIPMELGNLKGLRYLLLYNNTHLNGVMPDSICRISTLILLAVECDQIVCADKCTCRGADVFENMSLEQFERDYFSCSSNEKHEASIDCNKENGYLPLKIKIVPDNNPEETTWDISFNGKYTMKGDARQDSDIHICIPPIDSTCTNFTLHDTGGNGICCGNFEGVGSYTVFLDNEMVGYGGRFSDSKSFLIGDGCSR